MDYDDKHNNIPTHVIRKWKSILRGGHYSRRLFLFFFIIYLCGYVRNKNACKQNGPRGDSTNTASNLICSYNIGGIHKRIVYTYNKYINQKIKIQVKN